MRGHMISERSRDHTMFLWHCFTFVNVLTLNWGFLCNIPQYFGGPLTLFLIIKHTSGKCILSQLAQQHCHVFPKKPYILAGFEPGSFFHKRMRWPQCHAGRASVLFLFIDFIDLNWLAQKANVNMLTSKRSDFTRSRHSRMASGWPDCANFRIRRLLTLASFFRLKRLALYPSTVFFNVWCNGLILAQNGLGYIWSVFYNYVLRSPWSQSYYVLLELKNYNASRLERFFKIENLFLSLCMWNALGYS
jgi:hypothetical protein